MGVMVAVVCTSRRCMDLSSVGCNMSRSVSVTVVQSGLFFFSGRRQVRCDDLRWGQFIQFSRRDCEIGEYKIPDKQA